MFCRPPRTPVYVFIPLLASACFAQPLIETWSTTLSGQYARIYESKEAAATGTTVTTWPSTGNLIQALPAYTDIQKVEYSDDWVYISTTGLASHVMGPWYLDEAKNQLFNNLPTNQNTLTQFPRVPVEATNKEINQLGSLGLWVNGVALFNMLDGAFYDNGAESQDGGQGVQTAYWVRNAMFVEVVTFDNTNGHQPPSGTYHYHADPKALRYQLYDNVGFTPSSGADNSGVYFEDTSKLTHSPILAWSYDGFPIYGPYGYDDPDIDSLDTAVRRMESGFVPRDGNFGTVDLATTGRDTLAKWAAEMRGLIATGTTYTISDSSKHGPDVDETYVVGYWVEDYAHLGELGYTQGVDFDLDIYNGRFCRTPEFPDGVYAYFVTIDADGAPAYPYVIGRQWYGEVNGGAMTEITETTTTFIEAGPDSEITLTQSDLDLTADTLTLTWTSVEGGNYSVEMSNDLNTWQEAESPTNATNLATSKTTALSANSSEYQYYRVSLASLEDYDSEGSVGTGGPPDDGPPDGPPGPPPDGPPDGLPPDFPDFADFPELPPSG